MKQDYLAHIRENGDVQLIADHLFGTAQLASFFAKNFDNMDSAYICGLLHDIGKYSDEFQQRIRGDRHPVDHSTAGAIEINKRFHAIGFLLAYCIAGHHTGLPDGGSLVDTGESSTLFGRLRKNIKQYHSFIKEIDDSILPRVNIIPLIKQGFSYSFYVRMIFSCLVDADFLNTETFMNGKERSAEFDSIEKLITLLKTKLKDFANPQNIINAKRTEILNKCIESAQLAPGLFTLTVPTGGGKTLASQAFALFHAKFHHMDRVIYVIPYNSIIEQNAAVFKKILGERNVLEHHFGFSYNTDDDEYKSQQLATENWDMPVVVTTTVQFFESLFANKTSMCRKLHNIANSVIIFDEAQLIPVKYLLPCMRAISELVYNYKSTAVLCSATQPALGKLFPKELETHELCGNNREMYTVFKRTELKLIGSLTDESLAKQLSACKQVLCIVNTRKQAKNLFNLLDNDCSYHLSTLMYPNHRKKTLETIRQKLEAKLPCRVVSTSLIEAGVDVDFPVVYRAKAGIDSMIQAAGRCNREGKNSISPVYVFDQDVSYNASMLSTQKRPISVTEAVICQFDDIASPEAIQAYFKELYRLEGDGLDEKHIVERFEDGIQQSVSFPFSTVAKEFKLIDQATHAIFIPADKYAEKMYKQLKCGERSQALLRSVQQYTVNVYDNSYNALLKAGHIELLDEEIAVLTANGKYSNNTGLDITIAGGQALFG